jgi:hypothetical protein
MVTEMRDLVQQQQIKISESTPMATENHEDNAIAPEEDVLGGVGKLTLVEGYATFTGSSHWSTILDDIQQLKDELDVESPDSLDELDLNLADDALLSGPPLPRISLLSSAPPLSRDQILEMIPERRTVDRLVSHFFNAYQIGPFMIHRATFQREYLDFWQDPQATPLPWIGLLYAMMSTSAAIKQRDFGLPSVAAADAQSMVETYRTMTIHCLVACDYLRAPRYTVETLLLHTTLDYNGNPDASLSNWTLVAVVIRIAMRVGLHRDPSHWEGIGPLQAELRRRHWMLLVILDFGTSSQVGLPRIIKDSQCDTRTPRHLLEDDLTFETNEMPPARSTALWTPLLSLIAAHGIVLLAGEIYDATEAGDVAPRIQAAFSQKLEDANKAVPASLQYNAANNCIVDSPDRHLSKIIVNTLYHKTRYLLHRRGFQQSSKSDDSLGSTQICMDAAFAILAHQRRLSEETHPDGLLYNIRWKVATLLGQEFLQATTILCVAFSRTRTESVNGNSAGMEAQAEEISSALKTSRDIWLRNAANSVEARKAIAAIDTVLRSSQPRDEAPAFMPPPSTPNMPDNVLAVLQPDSAPANIDNLFMPDFYNDAAWDPTLIHSNGVYGDEGG